MTGLVVVVGSLNQDTTLRVHSLPGPGETTLTEGERLTSPGGKGANQAAAAAVLGARVAMVGAVGDDEPGEQSLTALRKVGVDVAAVKVRDDVGTGIATITVDAGGENTIVVDSGANASLTAQEATAAVVAADPAVLLLQLEVPHDVVTAAARAAPGAVVVLNPAPMPGDPGPIRDMLSGVDVLVPNRSELGRLAGLPEPTDATEVVDCVAALGHAGSVVVTLGADGALCFEKGAAPVAVPGVPTATRDASGAGDVFCGCLAKELARGTSLLEAVREANILAAASTGYPGARIPADLANHEGRLNLPSRDFPRSP
ncbi:ribokinase [Nocardioides flavus (ex Wang et al. 2016)]|uniref:Ribokinase n=1 Tax=Nocardioides flavus (ex Wang et al. 2016) TaxID=2058780 RepID=A0ABQ3HH22_9ACTN|nr:ribokinase [Nocardioides flavus (ex Wang et al. 2016)]GHE15837.1 ribokinase [Nocardioides flavus (ex Wang et al. 2016)]